MLNLQRRRLEKFKQVAAPYAPPFRSLICEAEAIESWIEWKQATSNRVDIITEARKCAATLRAKAFCRTP